MNSEREEAYQRLVYYGTSTWTYPGWQGIVYHRTYTPKTIKTESLGEYVQFKPFSTVGIDHTFYSPPSPYLLKTYARFLPPGFKCVSKVWEEITIKRYPPHPRYGAKAGQENPHFLDAEKFKREVLAVYEQAFGDHTGPFVFEFGTMRRDDMPSVELLAEALSKFFAQLPKDYRYATEIRNPQFLQPPYFEALREHGVAHCFNQWNYMPPIRKQLAAAGHPPVTADFVVARILTPPGVSYEKAVQMFQPYDRLKQPLPQVREDIERLVRTALEHNLPIYVIVNNRAEGSAPLTIREVDQQIRANLG